MTSLSSLPNWAWAVPALAIGLAAGLLIGNSGDETSAAEDAAARPITSIRDLGSREIGGATAAAGRSASAEDSARSDEEAAARVISMLSSPSRLDRIQRLLAFLDQLPDEQFGAVYAEIANSPLGEDRQSERSLILQAWAERDPYAATAFLQENGAEDWERETTVSTWAAYDPQGAFAWASAAEDDGRVNNWVVGTLRGIAETSPELARDFLVSIEDGRTQRSSLANIQSSILRNGFGAAEAWVAALEPGTEVHHRAARYLANDLTELDPEEAGRWAASLTDPETRGEVSETVSEDWAREDLEGARAWVETLPEDALPAAAEGLTETWAAEDPVASAEWINSLGTGPEFDEARREYVQETWRDHPEAALGMAVTINDVDDRNRYTRRFLDRWRRDNEEAARNWAAANQAYLSPEVIERVFR